MTSSRRRTRCPNCGAPVTASARFCSSCGYGLTADAVYPHAIASPPPQARNARQIRPAEVIVLILIAAAIVVGLSLLSTSTAPSPTTAGASGSPGATTGWFDFSGSTITRVPSGDTSVKYASGVPASTGDFMARLHKDPKPDTCTLGQNTSPVYSGPYTNWGAGHSPTFPLGGFTTSLDVFLDVDFAISNPDSRFDWASSISDTGGNKLRDFVFNVGTDATGFVMTTGTAATRCSSVPGDPDPSHAPVVHITKSGWYRFKHVFRGDAGGPLTVTQTVAPATSPEIPIGTWTHADPADRIGTTIGGINEGSFVQNELDGLAIDNTTVGTVGDLSVQISDTPDPVTVGGTLTYTVTVSNDGPAAVSDVEIVDTLPKGTGVGSAESKEGTCTRATLSINCKVGTIARGDSATVTIVLQPSVPGTLTNVAIVSAPAFTDWNALNNSATQSTTIRP